MATGSCLPEDMVRETMLRLPVQSLLRFKSVCKHWLALITSSDFIHNHCEHCPKHTVMLTSPKSQENRGISFFPADTTCELDHQNLPSSMINNDAKFSYILGSGNGLLCVSIYYKSKVDYFLWNLATRKHRLLPFPPKLGNYTRPCTYGFGFVPEINDYKLLIADDVSTESHLNLRAEVYTLSTDSWKEVEGIAYSGSDLGHNFPVVVQGMWYDLIFRDEEDIQGPLKESRKVPSILTFDMGNDVFSKMEDGLPYDNACDRSLYLMVYKELLAMGVYRDEESTFELEIWTLMKNEYCWTKLFICRSLPKTMNILPLGFRNDKEIIISDYCLDSCHDQLQLYDPSTQQSNMVSTNKDFVYYEAHNYVESLVSVYGAGQGSNCSRP